MSSRALRVNLQKLRAEHRSEREAHQQGDHDGHGHGPTEGVDVAPGIAIHKGNREENDDQRKRGGHDSKADFASAFNGGAHAVRAFFFHITKNVFENDDGVVNHDAHGEGKREQRHVVERKVHVPHQGEADEQQHDDAGQQAAENQMLEERVDGGLDERSDVLHHLKLHARGHLQAQGFNASLHFIRHAHRIRARLPAHLDSDHIGP